jgi:hypothetical protein
LLPPRSSVKVSQEGSHWRFGTTTAAARIIRH